MLSLSVCSGSATIPDCRGTENSTIYFTSTCPTSKGQCWHTDSTKWCIFQWNQKQKDCQTCFLLLEVLKLPSLGAVRTSVGPKECQEVANANDKHKKIEAMKSHQTKVFSMCWVHANKEMTHQFMGIDDIPKIYFHLVGFHQSCLGWL